MAKFLGDLVSLLDAAGQHERALAAYGEADGLYTSAQSAGRWCPAVPPLAVAFGLGLSRWLGTRALRPTFLEVVSTARQVRSEEHTSELQSLRHIVCRLLL